MHPRQQLSCPVLLQSFLPLPLHPMNLDAAGPHLPDHSVSNTWDNRAAQWRWKMGRGGGGAAKPFRVQQELHDGVFHLGAFSEGGSECSTVSIVVRALGWHQVLLYPNQEYVA